MISYDKNQITSKLHSIIGFAIHIQEENKYDSEGIDKIRHLAQMELVKLLDIKEEELDDDNNLDWQEDFLTHKTLL
jgi:hypothetical protein